MIALWIYRRMLVFYPSALRSAYGAQMAEEFREEWAAARCAGWPAAADEPPAPRLIRWPLQ